MNLKHSIVTALLPIGLSVSAQQSVQPIESDSLKAIAPTEKNLKFSILGGPGYTPDYGFLVGGAALFTFSMDPADKNLQRSVMPFSFGVTFAKPIGLNLMIKPQLFFKEDRIRLFGSFIYKNTNDNYYGVGYATNKVVERGDNTQYHSSAIQVNPILMFRIPKSHFYVGPMLDFIREKITEPGETVINDPLYIKQGGDSLGINLRSVGLGAVASYDTRDVAANAYQGVYFEMKAAYYAKAFGSNLNFGTLQFDYRQYMKLPLLGERRVLAWNVISKNAFGDVPFTRLPLIGNPFDLRGYYMGQYRDKSTLVGVAEYRHMFNFGTDTKAERFWSRFGFAAWGGVGFMGPNPVKYEAVLPNFGAGIRIELQPRMNFRFDVGYSPVDKQTLFYFNMTEAF
ncbi:MAG: BamA/TamA family outer membrane protein [Bacteroidales bacterium]